MKILMLDPSGANPYGAYLSNALARQGVDVTLFLSRSFVSPATARCDMRLVAPRHAHGETIRKTVEELAYLLAIYRASRSVPQPLIHVQWIRVGIETRLLAAIKAKGGRVVVTAHNVAPHEATPDSRRGLRKIYELADRLIVHDLRSRQSLSEMLGIPMERIAVIPIGVEQLPEQRIVPSRIARLRLQVPLDFVVFTSFGIVRPYKGYDELVPAFGVAARKNAAIALLIAGHATRQQHEHIESLVAQLDRESRERVYLRLSTDGPLGEELVDNVFGATDCVMLPYRAISQSAVAVQAQSYGKAVLAFRVGGLPDVVVDGVNGRLVPPGDVQELAAQMCSLGESRAVLAEWGVAGRKIGQEQFGWDGVATKTIEVYRGTIGV